MAKIGYGKIGRTLPLRLEDCGTVGGDVECRAILEELALRRPQDTFYLLGKNRGDNPQDVGLPSNVVNPWTEWRVRFREWINSQGLNYGDLAVEDQLKIMAFYRAELSPTFKEMDHIIMLVGQHGSSNSPLPMSADPGLYTKPYDWEVYYCAYLFDGVNAWRDQDPIKNEEIYINTDSRNYHKMRDLRWPWQHPCLSQYDYERDCKHERWTSGESLEPWDRLANVRETEVSHVWQSTMKNVYARAEINALTPVCPFGQLVSYDETWEGRESYGLFINEARAASSRPELIRGTILKRWVFPFNPAFLHGKWTGPTLRQLGRRIVPAPWDQYFPLLHSVHSTFTSPSSGSGWATTKPWEAFAAGTVCFFHYRYDDQDHILGDAPEELRNFLRCPFPGIMQKRMKELDNDKDKWQHIIRLQRAHFDKAMQEMQYVRSIEERLDG